MKYLIIIFAILFSFMQTSCGTKKKAVSKTHEIDKSQFEATIQKDVNVREITSENDLSVTYEPIDNDKPMIADGKEYNNTKVTTSKKEKTTEKESTDKSSSVTSGSQESEKSTKDLDLDVDRSFNVFDWLWLFIAIGIVIFAIRLYIKKINPISWVKSKLIG